MKKILTILIKYVLLVVLMALLWIASLSAASAIVGYQEPQQQDQAAANNILAKIVLACAINVGIITYVILRSRWRGLRLVGVIALQIFGIQFSFRKSKLCISIMA